MTVDGRPTGVRVTPFRPVAIAICLGLSVVACARTGTHTTAFMSHQSDVGRDCFSADPDRADECDLVTVGRPGVTLDGVTASVPDRATIRDQLVLAAAIAVDREDPVGLGVSLPREHGQ